MYNRIVYLEGGHKVTLKEEQLNNSVPLESHDVRIKPILGGICGSDLHNYNSPTKVSVYPGHEVVARVQCVGSLVTNMAMGDRVVLEPLISCGECAHCLNGKRILCSKMNIIGVHQAGGLCDSLVVPRYTLYKVPSEMDDFVAVLTEPIAVGVHAYRTLGFTFREKSNHDNILILGCGSIGLTLIALAPYFGIQSISISAKYQFQREAALKIASLVKEKGLQVNVYNTNLDGLQTSPHTIIETVGGSSSSTLVTAIDKVAIGGKVVVIGVFSPGVGGLDPFKIFSKSLTVIGCMCYDTTPTTTTSTTPLSDFDVSLEVLKEKGDLFKEVFVSHVFELDNIAQAFETANRKETTTTGVTGNINPIKVVVKINK